MGADGRATLGDPLGHIAHIPTRKIEKIGDDVLVATAGSVGLRQRFGRIVGTLRLGGAFDAHCIDCSLKITTQVVKSFQESHLERGSGYDIAALVAAPFDGVPELVEFEDGSVQPERKTPQIHFVSIGAGQRLADPFLGFVSRVLWEEKEPTVYLAKIGILWALHHTSLLSPLAIGPPLRLGILSKSGDKWCAEVLDEEEFGEQLGHIKALERGMPDYVSRVAARESAEPLPPDPIEQ